MITFLLSLILMSVWVGFYQLVKQQGRLLLRLDDLERAVANSAQRTHDHQHSPNEENVFEGLPFGTLFPAFALPDLSGTPRSLSDFDRRRLLLIHWDFDCGFCEAIAGDLASLEADLEARNTRILLLSSGDEKSNRKHATRLGLKAEILLNGEQAKVPEPFEHQGTPVAYLVDEHGRVAAPFANGADQVLALAQRISSSTTENAGPKLARSALRSERSLSQSRIERNGLKAGTPAPTFRLPDLQGRYVSLDDYQSQRVLLVFSDPHCGPCDELAPHLVRLHRERRDRGIAVILVGRGTVEENRTKAEKFGFEFPVVLQDNWKLSKEYGIFATPVAFLIAEDGVIAQDVAVGKDAILSLAADAARLEETRVQ